MNLKAIAQALRTIADALEEGAKLPLGAPVPGSENVVQGPGQANFYNQAPSQPELPPPTQKRMPPPAPPAQQQQTPRQAPQTIALSLDDIKVAFTRLHEIGNKQAILDILRRLGCERVTAIPPERYADAVSMAQHAAEGGQI